MVTSCARRSRAAFVPAIRPDPLIIGSNADETSFVGEPDLNEELRLAGLSGDEVQKLYPEIASKPEELAAELYSDRVYSEPVRMLARSHAATGGPTFRYRFAYVPEAQRASREGGHGRELQFVFGIQGVRGRRAVRATRDRELGNLLRNYWTNFARTGDPNGRGLPQ